MKKIVIVGPSGSGKSCYFLGAFSKMVRGVAGNVFTVLDRKNYYTIRKAWLALYDANLTINERCPNHTDMITQYKLEWQYNMANMDTLAWCEIPGKEYSEYANDISNSNYDELLRELRDADCIMVCFENLLGASIMGPDSFSRYLETVLQLLRQELERLPPICILCTKYDKYSMQERNAEYVINAVKCGFPYLFSKDQQMNSTVSICPVSLSQSFGNGGKSEPLNVEKPICFALYCIVHELLVQMETNHTDNISTQWKERYHVRDWYPGKDEEEKMRKQEFARMRAYLKAYLDSLHGVIAGMPLYNNGEEYCWS